MSQLTSAALLLCYFQPGATGMNIDRAGFKGLANVLQLTRLLWHQFTMAHHSALAAPSHDVSATALCVLVTAYAGVMAFGLPQQCHR